MSTKLMNAIREIATNLQVGDTVRAHAMMEAVAIYEGVDTASVYAIAEQVVERASSFDVVARDLCLDSALLEAALHRLNTVRPAA